MYRGMYLLTYVIFIKIFNPLLNRFESLKGCISHTLQSLFLTEKKVKFSQSYIKSYQKLETFDFPIVYESFDTSLIFNLYCYMKSILFQIIQDDTNILINPIVFYITLNIK